MYILKLDHKISDIHIIVCVCVFVSYIDSYVDKWRNGNSWNNETDLSKEKISSAYCLHYPNITHKQLLVLKVSNYT